MNILERIVADKRREVAELRTRLGEAELRRRAEGQPRRDFVAALRAAPGGMGLIAEVKRRSPSRGEIRPDLDPAGIARAYAAAGAQVISVLMDRRYFGGGEEDFREVRAVVDLPLLYKEFVIDPVQVWHAAALGASAVLLIAALYPEEILRRLVAECGEAGVSALVEVHSEEELGRALRAGAQCIGINNRDLRTFEVSVDTTRRLARLLARHPGRPPGSVLKISESGIADPGIVAELRELGIEAVLVGEHLLRQADPGEGIRRLMARVWGSS